MSVTEPDDTAQLIPLSEQQLDFARRVLRPTHALDDDERREIALAFRQIANAIVTQGRVDLDQRSREVLALAAASADERLHEAASGIIAAGVANTDASIQAACQTLYDQLDASARDRVDGATSQLELRIGSMRDFLLAKLRSLSLYADEQALAARQASAVQALEVRNDMQQQRIAITSRTNEAVNELRAKELDAHDALQHRIEQQIRELQTAMAERITISNFRTAFETVDGAFAGIRALQSKLSELEVSETSRSSKIKRLDADLTEAQEKLDDFVKQLTQLPFVSAGLRALEGHTHSTDLLVQKLREEVEATGLHEEALDERSAAMARQISALNADNRRLAEEASKLKHLHAENAAEIKKLRTHIVDLQIKQANSDERLVHLARSTCAEAFATDVPNFVHESLQNAAFMTQDAVEGIVRAAIAQHLASSKREVVVNKPPDPKPRHATRAAPTTLPPPVAETSDDSDETSNTTSDTEDSDEQSLPVPPRAVAASETSEKVSGDILLHGFATGLGSVAWSKFHDLPSVKWGAAFAPGTWTQEVKSLAVADVAAHATPSKSFNDKVARLSAALLSDATKLNTEVANGNRPSIDLWRKVGRGVWQLRGRAAVELHQVQDMSVVDSFWVQAIASAPDALPGNPAFAAMLKSVAKAAAKSATSAKDKERKDRKEKQKAKTGARGDKHDKKPAAETATTTKGKGKDAE